jgi:hypothetical protein
VESAALQLLGTLVSVVGLMVAAPEAVGRAVGAAFSWLRNGAVQVASWFGWRPKPAAGRPTPKRTPHLLPPTVDASDESHDGSTRAN